MLKADQFHFRIEICTSAFDKNQGKEIARMLRAAARIEKKDVYGCGESGAVKDNTGAEVGRIYFT